MINSSQGRVIDTKQNFFNIRTLPKLVGVAVFIIPFVAYGLIVLSHFYVQGGYFLDSGLQAALIWHSDAVLTSPPSIGATSFFATHFSPIFLVLSALSWALPISLAQYFAIVIAVGHALPAIGVYWIFLYGYGWVRGRYLGAAALLAVAYAFNGIALAIIRFPHLEILMVAAVLLFLVSIALEAWGTAIFLFIAALSIREDAGFHLFALLFVLITVQVLTGKGAHWMKLTGFAVAALVYSMTILLVQKWVFGGGGSFARIYLGDPAFAHLTWAGTWVRLVGYFTYRPYVMLPALCAAIASRVMRNPVPIVGYVAFFPWLALHLVADSPIAGTLSAYYAYPFMIAAFCPLLAGVRGFVSVQSSTTARPAAALFGVMLVASWTGLSRQYNPGNMDLWRSLAPPSLERQKITDRAVATIAESRRCLGRLAVDNAILSLAPGAFQHGDLIAPNMDKPFDAVIYFVRGFDRGLAWRLSGSNNLNHHFAIAGTSIRIATRRPIGDCGFGSGLRVDPNLAE